MNNTTNFTKFSGAKQRKYKSVDKNTRDKMDALHEKIMKNLNFETEKNEEATRNLYVEKYIENNDSNEQQKRLGIFY